MLDLVENPEDRFSHNEAQSVSKFMFYKIFLCDKLFSIFRLVDALVVPVSPLKRKKEAIWLSFSNLQHL